MELEPEEIPVRARPRRVPRTRNTGRRERKIGVKSTSYTALYNGGWGGA